VNLRKEHTRLQRRLDEVQDPEFLLNLKRQIKVQEKKQKDLKKARKELTVEQIRREKQIERAIDQQEPDNLKNINDSNSRLTYLTEKVTELKE